MLLMRLNKKEFDIIYWAIGNLINDLDEKINDNADYQKDLTEEMLEVVEFQDRLKDIERNI